MTAKSLKGSGIFALLVFSMTVVAQQPRSKREMSPEQLSQATLGAAEQQRRPFPPHKIIGNVYFVGTEILGSFLVTTSQGHILINSGFESTVPSMRDAVEKLGFKFSDVKVILGSHAHDDHMQGDALVKQMTGAQVLAMEQDVAALQRMRPGDKPHPIDRVLRDRDQVQLGGVALTALLTPGHTSGNTTWLLKAEEGGKTYNVVILGGQGATGSLYTASGPTAATEQFKRSFPLLRSIPCDVPLGSHTAMFNMLEKYPRIGKGPNPYIDPAGYVEELDARERVFNIRLTEQMNALRGK
jgi:metallo-beta-lactamase class B